MGGGGGGGGGSALGQCAEQGRAGHCDRRLVLVVVGSHGQPPSPLLSLQASVQLLASLELVAMEGEEPLSPHSLDFSASSQETSSVTSAPAFPFTASTVLCSTEGSQCVSEMQ